MPLKDGTGPMGQGSRMGRGQGRAGRNKLQQCGTGWGRGQKPGTPVRTMNQPGMGRRFNLTNQDDVVPQGGAGRRDNCRFRLMSNNPNI